jgi:hypothetical protein
MSCVALKYPKDFTPENLHKLRQRFSPRPVTRRKQNNVTDGLVIAKLTLGAALKVIGEPETVIGHTYYQTAAEVARLMLQWLYEHSTSAEIYKLHYNLASALLKNNQVCDEGVL